MNAKHDMAATPPLVARPLTVTGDAWPRWGGEPVLSVHGLHGHERLGHLYAYTLELRTREAATLPLPLARTLVVPGRLVGTGLTVSIAFADRAAGAAPLPADRSACNAGAGAREITGLVTSFALTGEDERHACYALTLRPWLWLATLNRENRAFQNQSVIEITDAILKSDAYPFRYAWRLGAPGSGGVYPKRDFVRQLWESDFAFLSRLWREWGLTFFMEGATLVIGDSPGAHPAHAHPYDTIRYHAPHGKGPDEEHIHRLHVAHTLTAGTVSLVDYDYTRARAELKTTVSGDSLSPFGHAEHYGWGDYAQPRAGAMGLAGAPNDAAREARLLATVQAEALRSRALSARGQGNLRGLAAGRTFRLEAHPEPRVNTDYLVLATTLDIRNPGTESGDDACHCVTDFVVQPARVPFRNRARGKPHCGPETAIVSGPAGRPVWVDGYARVKVQFVWDRQGSTGEYSSGWLRVASPWQGNGFGFVALPRIGEEVTVSYHEGDPDKPYVSGRQVNEFNLPPWELPRNHALGGWRSGSLAGGASNQVVTDDTPGQLQVQVASDHGQSRLVLGYNTRIEGRAGRQEARGEGFALETMQWGVVQANRGLLVTTDARAAASASAKHLDDACSRLAQAHEQHAQLARLAQRHAAQPAGPTQQDAVQALDAQRRAIRGGARTPDTPFPELMRPDLVLASAAGLATGVADSTHLASARDHAVSAGRDISVAGGRSLFASVREAISLFAQRAGMTLTAAFGRVRIEAQQAEIELIAQKVLSLISATESIRLTAAKSIELNVSGTRVRLGPQGFAVFTQGVCHLHAADHQRFGPQGTPAAVPERLVEDAGRAAVAEHFVLADDGSGLAMAHQRYRITLDDGKVIEGVSNEYGETSLAMSERMQIAQLALLREDGSTAAIRGGMLIQSANRKGRLTREDQA